jgi:spore coat polysaccharide biosynthesis protein SpsF
MRSTTAIIQARMGSERLPGKIMAQLAGRPMLDHVIERTALATEIDDIIVATSDQPADLPVFEHLTSSAGRWAKQVRVVRGSERDVLQRYAVAAATTSADLILRITGDCPLIDWSTIDALIRTFMESDLDYLGAGVPSGFPRGLDCEIFARAALETAAREATDPSDREHVTRFLYMRPDLFRCSTMPAPPDLRRDYRLCVDEALDLELVRSIYQRLWSGAPIEIASVIALLDNDPALAAINSAVAQRAH